ANARQRERLGLERWAERWPRIAPRLRFDPGRDRTATLEALAAYLEPDDVLVDVGGGAGRLGLPLAARCRAVPNVEPEARMGEEFEAAAREAGEANARWLRADWLHAAAEGDVVLASNVVSFVGDVVPFVRKLIAAARRRVLIVGSTHPMWDEAQ